MENTQVRSDGSSCPNPQTLYSKLYLSVLCIVTTTLLLLLQVDMVSPLTQSQITLPVGLDRATAREQLWWLSAACRLLETRLLQVGLVCLGFLPCCVRNMFRQIEGVASRGTGPWSHTHSPLLTYKGAAERPDTH
jgi:hypothetical protein